MGEALENIWLLTSVGETESDSGVIWTKKQATRENHLQYFGCLLNLMKLTLILERPGQENTNVTSLSFIDKKVSSISW